MKNTIKSWYIRLLEKDKKNFFELLFYSFLYLASLLYGAVVNLRNFFYDKGLAPAHKTHAKVISIGNLSWAGSGKTTLAMHLYDKLSSRYKVAVLRRGYGNDEAGLYRERGIKFYSSPNRAGLAGKLAAEYDVFILDDGFQHRKLARNLDIVVMAAREFRRKMRLIPADIFRENIRSLARASILILNYRDELKDLLKIKQVLQNRFPQLKIYFASYRFKGFCDMQGKQIDTSLLKNRKIAAMTATGYPQGFFNKLQGLSLNVAQKVTYPDHYELNREEFIALQERLKNDAILDLVITHKDKYHIPQDCTSLNVYVMEIEMQIEEEEGFLSQIKGVFTQN